MPTFASKCLMLLLCYDVVGFGLPCHGLLGDEGLNYLKALHLVISWCLYFRADFIKHPYERPWVRPAQVYTQPEGDIDHYTNYKKDYTGKVFSCCHPVVVYDTVLNLSFCMIKCSLAAIQWSFTIQYQTCRSLSFALTLC